MLCNKLSQIWWLKATEMYSHSFEGRRPKSKVLGCTPRGSWREPVPWHYATSHVPPSLYLLLCLIFLLQGQLFWHLGLTHILQDNLISKCLITSAKTLFSNQVNRSLGVGMWTYLWEPLTYQNIVTIFQYQRLVWVCSRVTQNILNWISRPSGLPREILRT